MHPAPLTQSPTRLTNCLEPAKRVRHAAFTLIELLTVVAIIGILAAIMIPTIGKVRKTAMSARCISNLRQIGAALAIFAAENKDRLPPRSLDPAAESHETRRYWTSRLYNQLKILRDRDVFYCPLAFPSRHSEASAADQLEANGGRTYGMRIWVPPGSDFSTARVLDNPITSIEAPSDFFLVADSVATDQPIVNGRPTQSYGISPVSGSTQRIHLRHNNRANALFADFHVAAKDATYFTTHISQNQAAYMNSGGTFTPLGENESY